jgi:hypothetical protein
MNYSCLSHAEQQHPIPVTFLSSPSFAYWTYTGLHAHTLHRTIHSHNTTPSTPYLTHTTKCFIANSLVKSTFVNSCTVNSFRSRYLIFIIIRRIHTTTTPASCTTILSSPNGLLSLLFCSLFLFFLRSRCLGLSLMV